MWSDSYNENLFVKSEKKFFEKWRLKKTSVILNEYFIMNYNKLALLFFVM